MNFSALSAALREKGFSLSLLIKPQSGGTGFPRGPWAREQLFRKCAFDKAITTIAFFEIRGILSK